MKSCGCSCEEKIEQSSFSNENLHLVQKELTGLNEKIANDDKLFVWLLVVNQETSSYSWQQINFAKISLCDRKLSLMMTMQPSHIQNLHFVEFSQNKRVHEMQCSMMWYKLKVQIWEQFVQQK